MNSAEDMELYCSGAYSPSVQLDELLDSNRTTLVAENGDQLIGYAQLWRSDDLPEGPVMEIDRFENKFVLRIRRIRARSSFFS